MCDERGKGGLRVCEKSRGGTNEYARMDDVSEGASGGVGGGSRRERDADYAAPALQESGKGGEGGEGEGRGEGGKDGREPVMAQVMKKMDGA